MSKICKTCKVHKKHSKFNKSKKYKDGHFSECKECMSIKRRNRYLKNYDKEREGSKNYYEEHKKEIYEKVDKEKKKENDKRYRNKNVDKLKEKSKIYYENNKEIIKEKRKIYYEKNKKAINKPTERKRELKRKYYRKRKHQYLWRSILRKTLKQMNICKNKTTFELIGYTYDELKENLENKFENGMTWENHGEWHIDHIIPISKFKKNTSPHIVNCLYNLRPLWKYDNIKRQNNISDMEFITHKKTFRIVG